MENKDVNIKKIPVDKFIDMLVDLYNKGVDYIDISLIRLDEGEDKLAIAFNKDYMSEQGQDYFSDESFDITSDSFETKLTDEDLNKLI